MWFAPNMLHDGMFRLYKKEGRVYLLRNGVNNPQSSQNIQMNRIERGQRNADPEERNMFQGLVSWANCLRFRHNAARVCWYSKPSL